MINSAISLQDVQRQVSDTLAGFRLTRIRYDLDSKEAAYEIVKWIYYFHFNSDESNTECYVPIKGGKK